MLEIGVHYSFYGLCAILAGIAARGVLGGRTIFDFSTLAAIMGLAWVIPQGIELESGPARPYAGEAFWLYVLACFLCITLGSWLGLKVQYKRIAKAPPQELHAFGVRRLLIAAVGLTAVGQFAAFQMRGIDTSSMGTQWTGIITMWALISKASGFGLCLAVIIFARTRSKAALAIAVVAVVPLAQTAFLGVRREALFDLVILTAGAWYVARRSAPPRLAVIAAILIGTVVLNTVGDLRERVQSGQESLVEVLISADTYESFNYGALGQGETSEVGLAQYDFWYANRSMRWELGAEYWNSLVSQYFPAFIFGRDLKDGIKISTLSQRISSGDESGAFSLGSTRTGFSDSYRGFGVFGCLVFLSIGYFFGVRFAKSSISDLSAQYIYLSLMAEGLKAITHSTAEFFSAMPFTMALYWLVFRYAKIKIASNKGPMLKKSDMLSK